MYNFENICRTCSSNNDLQCLFLEDNLKIADMLSDLVDIKVMQDDNLPQNICKICLEKLKSAYAFKKQCQEFYEKFQNLINKSIKAEVFDDPKELKKEVFDDSIEIKNENIEETLWNDFYDNASVTSPLSPASSDFNLNENTESNKIIKKNESKKTEVEELKTKKPQRKRTHLCNFCNKYFTYTQLRFHLLSHTKEKPYKCEVCDKEFSLKGNYLRHVKIHTGEKPHKCSICGRGFIQTTTLYEHIRIHTDETPFTCAQCGKSFKQAAQLRFHKRVKHTLGGTIKKPQRKKPKINPRPITYNYECEICYKKFKSKSILNTHTLVHGEKTFLCTDCGKSFVSKFGLQSHIKTHTGEKPYQCAICSKSFSQIASLKTHQLIHTGERPYKCEICSKTFKQKNHLIYHNRTHSGEKPYSCSVCGKQFALNGTLTVHMRIHTGETPYVCPVCNKGFYDSSSMKKHQKKHNE